MRIYIFIYIYAELLVRVPLRAPWSLALCGASRIVSRKRFPIRKVVYKRLILITKCFLIPDYKCSPGPVRGADRPCSETRRNARRAGAPREEAARSPPE